MNIEDYKKLFGIIYAFFNGNFNFIHLLDDGPAVFSIIGTEILREFYNVDAQVKAGFFAFNYDNNHHFIAGTSKGETSNWNNHHCWVEYDDKVIDFMAPIYDVFINLSPQAQVHRKMFFKDKSAAVTNLQHSNPGDFIIKSNQNLTNKREHWFGQDIWRNWLLEACLECFENLSYEPETAILSHPKEKDVITFLYVDHSIKIDDRW